MTLPGILQKAKYPVLIAVWLQVLLLATRPVAHAFERHPEFMLLVYNVIIGAALLYFTIPESLPRPSGGKVTFAAEAERAPVRRGSYARQLATALAACIVLWLISVNSGTDGVAETEGRDPRALGWIMAGLLLGVITGPLSAFPLFLLLGVLTPTVRVSGGYTLQLNAEIPDVLDRRCSLDGLEISEARIGTAKKTGPGAFELSGAPGFLSKLDGRRTISVEMLGEDELLQSVRSDRGFSTDLRLRRSGTRIHGEYRMKSSRMIDKLSVLAVGKRRHARLSAEIEAHRLSRICDIPVEIVHYGSCREVNRPDRSTPT